QFEITTSAALKLFAEVPADYLLLEVGLCGDFDSTNVIDHPLGTIITPVDLDHQKWLGNSIAEIAFHKVGIWKRGRPAALALSLEEMNAARPKPLVLILGMINTREPADFLEPFRALNPKVLTLTIPGEENAHKASYIADEARKAGFEATAFRALGQAID